jgi:hypothetical protein
MVCLLIIFILDFYISDGFIGFFNLICCYMFYIYHKEVPLKLKVLLLASALLSTSCVRYHQEVMDGDTAKVRFSLVSNEMAVVQIFDNRSCDNGRALGVFGPIESAAWADSKAIKNEVSRSMFNSSDVEIKSGEYFERILQANNEQVFSLQYMPPWGKTCSLTVATTFEENMQYELKFRINYIDEKCEAQLVELTGSNSPAVPYEFQKIEGSCRQLY